MGFEWPFIMERCMITEQMTDQEVSSFDDAIELYLNDSVGESDCIIATEIDRTLWKPIWEYRKHLEEYYEEEDRWDAEQDP